jgi:hypothetical protein
MTMDANLLLAHNDELTLFRQLNCGQKQSDELGACCWLSFAASSSTAHVIKVKRSDLTDPAPELLSASSIDHETNGGWRYSRHPSLSKAHASHQANSARESEGLEGVAASLHLCGHGYEIHHGPSTKE